MERLCAYFPHMIFFGVFGLLTGTVYLIRFFLRHKKRRSPFVGNCLRSPGQSLHREIAEINDEILTYLFSSLTLPVVLYAVHISQSYFGGLPENLGRTLISLILAISVIVFSMFRLIRLMHRRRQLRLGYDGELAAGQELTRLMRHGYSVFHDFPADKFNIDHIVVGPSGVFAVETKARRKPMTGNGTGDAKVIYDGQSLSFPSWTETKPLHQAIRQAQWLSRWLSQAVGQDVAVKPALALPGWYVDRRTPNGVAVMNPKQFYTWLTRSKAPILAPERVKQICHQLDQKCRDVEPKVNLEKKC